MQFLCVVKYLWETTGLHTHLQEDSFVGMHIVEPACSVQCGAPIAFMLAIENELAAGAIQTATDPEVAEKAVDVRRLHRFILPKRCYLLNSGTVPHTQTHPRPLGLLLRPHIAVSLAG